MYQETGVSGRPPLGSCELFNKIVDQAASWSTRLWTSLNNSMACWTKRTCKARSSYDNNWQIRSCTVTASGDRKQLTGTCCRRQSCVTGVRDVATSQKKLTQTIRPGRPPIRRWHVSNPQQPSLNIGWKHSKSRQVNTFFRYKYQRLDPKRVQTFTWSQKPYFHLSS